MDDREMCQDLDSHDIIIDEREGIEVCVKCGYIASNQLFMMDRKPIIPTTNKCLYYHFILETCHKLFISDGHAEELYLLFKTLSSKSTDKVINKYSIAAYSIYHLLKSKESQRTMKIISNYTNVPMKDLWLVEKHLIAKPTKAVDVLISTYKHMNLSEKDLSNLIKLSENEVERSFSPNTLSAAFF